MVASGVTSAPAKLTATTSTKRKRQDPPSLTTNSDEDSNSVEMPLVQKGPPSPTSLGSRCEDEDDEGGASGASCSSISSKKMRQAKLKDVGNHHDDDEEMEAPPMSPRVRKRLDDAKENASLFGPVCSQGEVIQWMSACHPDLIEFGRELEQRGYHTLSSIAFLTEDDIDCDIDASIKHLLLTTLSRLRHELFRM